MPYSSGPGRVIPHPLPEVNFLMVEIPTPKPYIFMIRVNRQIKCLLKVMYCMSSLLLSHVLYEFSIIKSRVLYDFSIIKSQVLYEFSIIKSHVLYEFSIINSSLVIINFFYVFMLYSKTCLNRTLNKQKLCINQTLKKVPM